MESIKLLQVDNKNKEVKHSIENFTEKVVKGVVHESFDMYEPTPLAKLENTAKEFGVKVLRKGRVLQIRLKCF